MLAGDLKRRKRRGYPVTFRNPWEHIWDPKKKRHKTRLAAVFSIEAGFASPPQPVTPRLCRRRLRSTWRRPENGSASTRSHCTRWCPGWILRRVRTHPSCGGGVAWAGPPRHPFDLRGGGQWSKSGFEGGEAQKRPNLGQVLAMPRRA